MDKEQSKHPRGDHTAKLDARRLFEEWLQRHRAGHANDPEQPS